MSEATDLIRDLIAAGTDPELIARVSVLAARAIEIDRRRAADAQRQRNARARHVSHVMSRDGSDVTPPVDTTPQSKSSEAKKLPRSAACANALPTTWTLDEQDTDYARSKGWPEGRITSEGERFKNHALAGGRRQKDWHAAWRNWVTSPYQQQPKAVETNGKSVLAAADRLIDRLGGNEAAERYVPGSSGPRPLVLDNSPSPHRPKLVSSG